MIDLSVIKYLDSIYQESILDLAEPDKVFDTDIIKLQFIWSAYEESLDSKINQHSNIEKFGNSSLDKLKLSEFLSDNGFLDKYPSNTSINDQVKHVFESVNNEEVNNIAQHGDVIEALKRLARCEKEPDLKKRVVAIILAHKNMLSLCHAYFPEELNK